MTGTTTTGLGNAITPVALAFAVLDLGGSATELGLVVAAFSLAEVVTVLFGGVLGDRVPRKLMMEGSAAACVLTQAVVAALLIGGWATIPLLAGDRRRQRLPRRAERAVVLGDDPDDRAARGPARPRSPCGACCQTSAAAVGFALGGVLVAARRVRAGRSPSTRDVRGRGAVLRAAATYRTSAPEGVRPSMLADLGEGFREVFRHTWLWLLIGQALLYHLFYGGAQGVLGPIVVGDEFGRAAWGLALATADGRLRRRWPDLPALAAAPRAATSGPCCSR